MKTTLSLALFALFTVQPGLAGAEDALTRTFEGPVNRVQIHHGAGSVHIHAADATVVTARRRNCSPGEQPQIRLENGTLTVRDETRRGWGRNACQIDLDVAVPRQVQVDVEVGSGDLRILGVRGAVKLTSGSGDAVVEGEIAAFSAQLGNGDLDIRGLTEGARVEVGSGDVKLAYKRVPERGEIRIDTGTGDVALTLPGQARFAVRFQSGVGTFSTALAATPGAGFVISVQSGTGDLAIHTAK